jgi:transforming growth factor-beta-induced protein
MKNLLRNFTLVVISFLAFSCEDDQVKDLAPTSIAKIVAATPEFSSFKEALEVTGMTSTLDGAGTFTVLVPNDDAFAGVLGGLTVTEFNDANPGVLENILKYHIINSDVQTKDLTDGQEISTSLGQNITINLEDNPYYPEYDNDLGGVEQISIYANEARIFARDAKASNGRINVINAVLTPAGS